MKATEETEDKTRNAASHTFIIEGTVLTTHLGVHSLETCALGLQNAGECDSLSGEQQKRRKEEHRERTTFLALKKLRAVCPA